MKIILLLALLAGDSALAADLAIPKRSILPPGMRSISVTLTRDKTPPPVYDPNGPIATGKPATSRELDGFGVWNPR